MMQLSDWLRDCGGKGLEYLALDYFYQTGRGVKAMKRFRIDEEIMTIPSSVFWTSDVVYADSKLGPILSALDPPLSVEDTLATFILFVKSRKFGYEMLKLHIEHLPESYSSSVFFNDADLKICVGSSLYETTKVLKQQIKQDHTRIFEKLFVKHPDLFYSNMFSLEKVSTLKYVF